MTRAEHMAWAKARAIEYIDAGETPASAFTSFVSDLRLHPDTEPMIEFATMVGFPMLMAGQLNDPVEMKKWIEGFA